ncbi:MAG: hypothetical protein QOF48_304, partial [Verrucomicrobiota bacterium]
MLFRYWPRLCLALSMGLAPSLMGATSAAVVRNGTTYSVEQVPGLPGSSVITMLQTRDGYLWLGTLYGLVRFDGLKFKVFDESTTPELGGSPIVHLFEDRQGGLWVGTETAGVVLIKNGRADNLGIGRGMSDSRLVAACQDNAGSVWLLTADGWLWRSKNGSINKWRAGIAPTSLIADNSGILWLGMRGTVYSVEPAGVVAGRELARDHEAATRTDFLLASAQGGHWRIGDTSIQRWNTNREEQGTFASRWPIYSRVTTACEDSEGHLVVGTRGAGVFWFDEQGRSTEISTNQGLANSFVLSVHLDREGTLWIGTDGGGLYRLRRRIFGVIEPCRGWVVRAVSEDAEGGIWIGAAENDIARWKDGVLLQSPWLAHFGVRSVLADSVGRVWAGTWGAGLQQVAGRQFQIVPPPVPPRVSVIHEDRQHQLWVGTDRGLVRRDETGAWTNFGMEQGLSANTVQALADDEEGNLWIGTVGGGLNRLRNGQFTVFRKADGCPSDDISALYVDTNGVVWVGTFGSGLGRYSKTRWTRYSTRDGLVSNSVGFLIGDGLNNLWIGCNLGLARVEIAALNEFAAGRTFFIPCR